MINCLHFRANWGDRDRLDPTANMRMRRHLAVCQRCKAFDQQMRTSGYRIKGVAGTEEKQS